MEWIKDYQLFLFDFDGLLVNSEEIHHCAYKRMCERRGVELKWDFPTYCLAAYFNSTGIKEKMYADYPQLHAMEPNWDVLYAEKRKAYLELLDEGRIGLMPGVERLLKTLKKERIKSCVVTHSPLEQIQQLRRQIPLLDLIPHWITREDYKQPKPHPECYQKAIDLFAKDGDKIIGFEDTPRGLQALLGTRAHGVLISSFFNAQKVEDFKKNWKKQFLNYSSFNEIS